MTHAPSPAGENLHRVAIIPAGGVGSRLWPLSRPDRPKFLLDLLGHGQSLLQATVARVEPWVDDVLVVTGERHGAAVREQLPGVGADDVVTEPSPRDSMAAIALATSLAHLRHGPCIVASFAADHVIGDDAAFGRAVELAMSAAHDGKVVVIGLEPTWPSSAFGYIKRGTGLDAHEGVWAVDRFTEKPDPETAAEMMHAGGYLWNAGMFVVRTDVLLGHLETLQPALYRGALDLAQAWGSPQWEEVAQRVWPTMTTIAIDHAIAEPVATMGGVAVVPASFPWHDIGDFDSLVELAGGGADPAAIGRAAESVYTENSTGVAVVGGTADVAVVGVDDVVVVQTPDTILVVAREAAQDVKRVADRYRR